MPQSALPDNKTSRKSHIELIIATLGVILAVIAIIQTYSQNKVTVDAIHAEYKPYLNIRISDFSTKTLKYYQNKVAVQLSTTTDIEITNKGKTPAQIIYFQIALAPINDKQFNLKNIVRSAEQIQYSEDFYFQDSIRMAMTLSLNDIYLTTSKNFRFTRLLMPSQTSTLTFVDETVAFKKSKELYAYIYMIFEDQFGNFHDLYFIQNIERDTSAFNLISPVVEIDKYKYNPLPICLRK